MMYMLIAVLLSTVFVDHAQARRGASRARSFSSRSTVTSTPRVSKPRTVVKKTSPSHPTPVSPPAEVHHHHTQSSDGGVKNFIMGALVGNAISNHTKDDEKKEKTPLPKEEKKVQ